jgi:ABC-type transport system involved in cytochrome bd biosynthesis fused ATPase/permease subunit
VLDAGRIAERGTHEELMAAGGMYHDMVTRQMDPRPSRGAAEVAFAET